VTYSRFHDVLWVLAGGSLGHSVSRAGFTKHAIIMLGWGDARQNARTDMEEGEKVVMALGGGKEWRH
jgi:hypothetical protein